MKIPTYLSVVTTFFAHTLVGSSVIVLSLTVPATNQCSVVSHRVVGDGNILSYVGELLCLGTAVRVVLKHTLL